MNDLIMGKLEVSIFLAGMDRPKTIKTKHGLTRTEALALAQEFRQKNLGLNDLQFRFIPNAEYIL